MNYSKACNDCKQIKPLSEFNKKRDNRDGHTKQCRTCISSYSKIWYQKNKDQKNAKARERYQANSLMESQRAKRKYEKNKELYSTKRKEWVKNNREKSNLYSKRYREKHPEQNRIKSNAYRMRAKNLPSFEIKPKEIKRLFAKGCFFCESFNLLELDHVIPRNRGGWHSIGNVVAACKSCNASRKDLFIMEWRKKKLKR